jgi:16S rRNA (uracil1498-N3)-methyltransferase
VEHELGNENTLLLTGPQRRYLCTVLRAKPGEEIRVFDRSGWEYSARFVSADRRCASLVILGKKLVSTESSLKLILGQALLKAEKMEMVIQKAVELGASEIYPFTCERVVPIPHSNREVSRIERWKKIALEASRQCGRTAIVDVGMSLTFEEVLAKRKSVDLGLILSSKAEMPFSRLAQEIQRPGGVLVLVGPEGGFSDREAAMAIEQGFVPVSLGPRTLRAETAGIVVVGLVQHRFGDMG